MAANIPDIEQRVRDLERFRDSHDATCSERAEQTKAELKLLRQEVKEMKDDLFDEGGLRSEIDEVKFNVKLIRGIALLLGAPTATATIWILVRLLTHTGTLMP